MEVGKCKSMTLYSITGAIHHQSIPHHIGKCCQHCYKVKVSFESALTKDHLNIEKS